MKAKMFKTVEEWMSSKPDPEITQKVLTIVNREVVSQMKRELNGKKSELRKVEKTVESMKVIGLPIGDAVEKKITELKKELAELQKELPEPVRKKSAE
jgi:prefoldin subunit 5